MKKFYKLLSLFFALATSTAAVAQESTVSLTEVSGAPADGYYVVWASSSQGDGYIYTEASLTDRPYRYNDGVSVADGISMDTDSKYVWRLAHNEDGSFTLENYATRRFIVADQEKNKNMTQGTAAANLVLEAPGGDAEGMYVYQTNYQDGTANLYVHANHADGIDPNLSYWSSASVNGTSIRVKFYQLTGDFEALPEPEPYVFPFQLSQIENGKFAPRTMWYTLQIGASGLYVSDNADADYIALTSAQTELNDADLWCFVAGGDASVSLYNRATGVTKRLASPVEMRGTTGGEAYAILKEDGDDAYKYLWEFTETTLGDETAWFINQEGTPGYKLNNRSSKLAFWTAGADAGSSFVITPSLQTVPVSASTGTVSHDTGSGNYKNRWTSSEVEDFGFTLNANNMQANGDAFDIYSGTTPPCTVTFQAPEGWVVAGYSFDFVNTVEGSTYVETVSAGGQSLTSSTESQHVEVSGLDERTASFTQNGSNKGVTYSNLVVVLRRSLAPVEPSFSVFPCAGSEIPYRIPAITTASNGDVIAVADYRYSRADIGMANNGRIDLRGRISHDNGATWGDIFTIVEGMGANSPDFMHVGFGDPCIVADRESSRVLLMSCAGNVSYPSGTRDNHQNMARFYSEDNGVTWSEPEDIAETVYSQFDESPFGPVRAMFIGSGKISQSKTVKVGDYYRLYCAVLVKDVNGTARNFALYSDDFGGSWTVLGGTDVSPIPSGGDEPKAEEMPDGSVIVSSRTTGGRLYNIFKYTDAAKAEGYWETMGSSNASNSGVVATSNSTNGEIMFVPAVRKADNQPVFLALQSVPFGPSRANVGIYYKEIEGYGDMDNPANFSKDWDGRHQSSYLSSCYSTMTWQSDNTLGFIYEEDLASCSGGYTIVYKNYSLEQITDSAYTYNADGIDAQAFIKDGVGESVSEITSVVGTTVGMLTESGAADIEDAYNTYAAAPTVEGYQRLNAVIATAETNELTSNKKYRVRNYGRSNGTLLLKASADVLTVSTLDETDESQLFTFVDNEDGTWTIYNEANNVWIGSTPAVETRVPVVAAEEAASYTIVSDKQGLSSLRCMSPVNGTYPYIHLAGDNTRLVPWSASSPSANAPSFWYIEPTDIATAIDAIDVNVPASELKYYDLSGRRVNVLLPGHIYVTSDRRKVIVK